MALCTARPAVSNGRDTRIELLSACWTVRKKLLFCCHSATLNIAPLSWDKSERGVTIANEWSAEEVRAVVHQYDLQRANCGDRVASFLGMSSGTLSVSSSEVAK